MIICPNCGNKLNDDMLYCEVCGTEIQFVPDYEPEIEQSINESLSEIQLSDYDDFNEDYQDPYYDPAYADYSDYVDDGQGYYYGEEYIPEKPKKKSSSSNSSTTNKKKNSVNTESKSTEKKSAKKKSSSNKNNNKKNIKKNNKKKKGFDIYDIIESVHLFDKKSTKKSGNSDNIDSDEAPVKKDFLAYKRPDALVNIKPPADGPRVTHRLSDSLYDDMYDNDDIQEALDNLGEEYDMDPFDDFAYESYYLKQFLRFLRRSRLKYVILPLIILIIILICVFISKFSKKMVENNSYDYQMELAHEAASRNDYVTAIEYVDKAISLTDDNSSLKYYLSELYFLNNDPENAILMLWEVINYNDENLPMAYQKMLEYYKANCDYSTINKILNNCTNSLILQQYSEYMAPSPVFSVEEGVYESEMNVSISIADGNIGYIYYTVDGSEPTTESDVYVTPIYMDLGIYKISAMFVNQYGIKSDIVTKTYTIDMRVPNAPSVMIEGGDYTEPELIEIDVQPYTTVYYTTDGTTPNMFSNQYYSPVPMPIGASHFTFVAYSSEGVAGPFTEIDFNLSVDTELDIGAINYYLLIYNMVTGRTQDIDGHIAGNVNNRYAYSVTSAIMFDETIYYIFNEIIVEPSGKTTKTSNMFLASTEDGSIWNATKDENAIISLGDVIDPSMYVLPEPEGEEGEN